jgi:hypothetical protein
MSKTIDKLMVDVAKIPGGYCYSGVCSYQICFPLRNGGELRFSIGDDDSSSGEWEVDLYGGELPPGITGFAHSTGNNNNNNERTEDTGGGSQGSNELRSGSGSSGSEGLQS